MDIMNTQIWGELNPPYEQRWVMRSVRLDLVLQTGSVAERCA
jgi:hypothetical protein